MQCVRLALLGHPVSHSLSPQIHAAFGHACNIGVDYQLFDVSAAALAGLLDRFRSAGGWGVNVTSPHKQAAFALISQHSARAARAGAINTLLVKNDQWYGDNTDGDGLICDLTHRHGLTLKNRNVMLFGAGGAARGVAYALLDAGIQRLVIVNRTPSRAFALADELNRTHPAVVTLPWDQAVFWPHHVDVMINATSVGCQSRLSTWDILPHCVTPQSVVIDLNYGNSVSSFLLAAQKRGIYKTIDGLGMLVEQAALSFTAWFGVHPSTALIYAQLRQAITTGGLTTTSLA